MFKTRMSSVVLSFFCAHPFVLAQNAASVQGTITDATGAVIAGVSVSIENAAGTKIAETTTSGNGVFTFAGLPDGNDFLAVPAFGSFAASRSPIHVSGKMTGVKVKLQIEAVSDTVTVGGGPSLSTDASANRDTIAVTGNELRNLPVFDQDFIATLTPFLDGAAGSSGGVTLIVDGVEMKSVAVSPSAIQEVRINNDPYSALFTRPGRGRIEIVSKPGSPEFHGEFNVIVRNSVFNARNHFALVRPDESRRIYEGHLAGPVVRGSHTSFIVSGSRKEQDTAAIVSAVGPSGAINQNVPTPNRSMQFTGRLTHDFTPSHRLSAGYNFENSDSQNAGVGGIVLAEAGYNSVYREDDVIFNDRLILSPNLINQLQVTFEKDEDSTKSVTNAESVQVSGSFTGGGAQADLHRTENTIHMNEIASWSHGKHYVQAGVQLPQFSRRGVDDQTNRTGTLRYASLSSYTSNTPYVFTAQQGIGRAVYWMNEVGAFVQDQVAFNKKVQMTFGLRYDWQTFLGDNNNFAPRFSLAYAPSAKKTILRAGAGVFYDKTGGDFPATVKLHNGVALRTVQVQNPNPSSVVGGNFDALPSNIARFASNVRSPYALQYSVGVERLVGKELTITAGYRGQVQIKSFRSRDANAPVLPPDPVLSADYPRPDAVFGQVQQIESGGRTLLNAMDLSFRGRAGRWFSGQAQYTLSRFDNNTGGIGAFPQDQYHPNAEWGRADIDRLHRFNLIGNINPGGWASLGVNATIYSGTPYTETTGDDNYHTGLGNARPAGVGRNTLAAGGVASLDLLYNHDFFLTKARDDNARALTIGASAFNVLNRTNYTSYIGALSSSLFGQPTASLAGRQLQFNASYRF